MTVLNTLPLVNAGRLPRGIVKVNGTALPGWVEWEVTNNTHRQADIFRVIYACGKLPPSQNAAWLTAQTNLQVAIFAGFPPNAQSFEASQLMQLILGYCDSMTFDPEKNTIEMTGRDLTSELIDTKTSEKFLNQQASQIAMTIASRHGFIPDVDPTGSLDGSYYEIDHARVNSGATEWDLLSELADNEGYNVWMDGTTLHFKSQDSSSAATYMIRWTPADSVRAYGQANAMRLRFTRNNMLSQKNTQVSVNSWNAKMKQKLSGQATAARPNAVGTLNYVYSEPGLTQDQANTRAKEKLKGIIRNEMTLSASLPGDNILNVRALVQVAGTGTAFDQTYWPVSVTRRMSPDGGYEMDVEAKNHAPETESDS
jgi:phage protein D